MDHQARETFARRSLIEKLFHAREDVQRRALGVRHEDVTRHSDTLRTQLRFHVAAPGLYGVFLLPRTVLNQGD